MSTAVKRIMGVDPGSRITGVGIIDSDGQYSQYLHAVAIRLDTRADFTARLGCIFEQIQQLIQTYQPDLFAIEDVFVAQNAAAALKLGQARGAAICAAITANLAVAEYSPREVKQAVVGKGSADKTQVQQMVKLLLNQQGRLQADAADALAIALCHAHRYRFQEKTNAHK